MRQDGEGRKRVGEKGRRGQLGRRSDVCTSKSGLQFLVVSFEHGQLHLGEMESFGNVGERDFQCRCLRLGHLVVVVVIVIVIVVIEIGIGGERMG